MKLLSYRILIVSTFMITNLSFATAVDDGSDCLKDPMAGDPISNNRGVATIVETQPALAKSGLQQQDDDGFSNYLNIYCMTYERLEGVFEFEEKLITPMKVVSSDTKKYDAGKFWYHPGCNPQHIGGTLSPIIHLTAENATDRLPFLKALFKHVQKEGKMAWSKIVNAKNTRGQTVLDYLHYLILNKKIIKEQEKGVNELYQFLCANGGEFSAYTPKKCKSEYIKI